MLLSTKLKNLIKECPASKGIDFDFYLKNIVINGQKRGCSGFVVNKKNGNVIYVNTEKPVYGGVKRYLYRYADSINDYRGRMNRFCDKPEELAENICLLLISGQEHPVEIFDLGGDELPLTNLTD